MFFFLFIQYLYICIIFPRLFRHFLEHTKVLQILIILFIVYFVLKFYFSDIAFDNKSQTTTTTASIIPTKSQTNFTLSPPYMTFMSQSLNAIPTPKPLELNEIPSPKELDLNEIRIPSSSSSSSGAHPFRGENYNY